MQARAIELHEKTSMPWAEAERLALSEAGIDDAAVDELIGECGPSGLKTLLADPDDLRDYTRSVLVHQPVATPPAVAVTETPTQLGYTLSDVHEAFSRGAAGAVQGLTDEQIEAIAREVYTADRFTPTDEVWCNYYWLMKFARAVLAATTTALPARLLDSQIEEALNGADFASMVTADDYMYVCARAVETAVREKFMQPAVMEEKP